LVDGDDSGFGFWANPEDVGMIGGIDAAATVAFVARIEGKAIGAAARGVLAIERFGQGAGHAFQFADGTAGEKVGVSEAIALQTALEQLGDSGLLWKIGEHVRSLVFSIYGRRSIKAANILGLCWEIKMTYSPYFSCADYVT
jgi:hypothetical protein